jgi:putative flippase GtrA
MEIPAKADAVLSRVCGNGSQFARYLGIGILATLVDWAIFYLLIGFLGVFYVLALAASYFASTAFNFFMNRRYTFRNTYRRVHVQLAIFLAVAIIGLGLNETIVYSLAHLLPGGMTDIALMAARMIATLVVFLWNFALNKRITFRLFQ